MNYFDQIMAGSEQNILMLLGGDENGLDSITKKALFKRNVEIINLELSYLCNRKCDYCPVMSSTRQEKQSLMTYDLLEKICGELAEIRYENRISLNLYNEPLLDHNLENKISIIRKYLPYSHVAFNTNGDKLSYKRLASISDAGCDYICVTLHPPQYKTQSLTVIKKRVEKIYEKLTGVRIRELDFLSNGFFEFRSLGVTIKLQWPNWRVDGTNRAGLLIGSGIGKTLRTQPCVKPFREFTIFYDGIVQPCCEAFHDEKVSLAPMGNLNEDSIFDIYSSNLMSSFRRHVFDFGSKKGICEHCSVMDYSDPESDAIRKTILSKIKS